MSQKPKAKKDIGFVVNAFVIAILLLAIMHEFKPYLEPPDPLKPHIMDYAAELQVKKPEELPALLKSQSGKPTLLVVFAAWCGYCRLKMPGIVELVEQGKLNHVDMVFVSRDTSPMKLSEYMVHEGFYRHVKPYMVENSFFDSIEAPLLKVGSQYKGAIPFFELYNAEGHAVQAIPYDATADALLEATKGPL